MIGIHDLRWREGPLAIQGTADAWRQARTLERGVGDWRHRLGHVLLVVLHQRGRLPMQDTFCIKSRVVQSKMDQILIERAPAFSIGPIHHCEEGKPRVTDDRDASERREPMVSSVWSIHFARALTSP